MVPGLEVFPSLPVSTAGRCCTCRPGGHISEGNPFPNPVVRLSAGRYVVKCKSDTMGFISTLWTTCAEACDPFKRMCHAPLHVPICIISTLVHHARCPAALGGSCGRPYGVYSALVAILSSNYVGSRKDSLRTTKYNSRRALLHHEGGSC